MTFKWSKANTEILTGLWAENFTASEIAHALQMATGAYLSRSAVIGQAHRLGLRKAKPQPKAESKPKRTKTISVAGVPSCSDIAPVVAAPVPLVSFTSFGDGIRKRRSSKTERIGSATEPVTLTVYPLSVAKQSIWLGSKPEAPRVEETALTGPISFMELRDGRCKFPLWGHMERPSTDRQFFCGEKASGPYCETHRLLCCVPLAQAKAFVEQDGSKRRRFAA